MSIIKWSDDYSVGVKQIDDQHKELVDLINRLFDAMSLGKGREVLESVFDQLRKYTHVHFQTEERLMVIYGYPNYEEHKKEHEELINQINELKDKFKAGDRKITIEVVDFLKEWLLNHIKKEDQQYKSHFAERGLSN
jgi:hemerythrin